MNGADVLVSHLHSRGIRTIFGMPGSHTTAIYDAIERHGGIRTVLIRNEQAGAYAADGYTRVTGRPGVICTTAGPGATNALSGIAEAWADSVPVLLIAGQVNHDRLHEECGNYHEIDLEGIFRPCTKSAVTLADNRQIPTVVAHAFDVMQNGRPRPAALILPQDLMASSVDFKSEDTPCAAENTVPTADPATIDQAVALLSQARRPLILAGGGAVSGRAGDEIQRLAGQLDCPFATTINGKGILDERDPRALGHVRSSRARVAWPRADLVLAVGCRFTEVTTSFRKLQLPGPLVQIDIDPAQLGMNYPTAVGITADAAPALRAIREGFSAKDHSDWSSIWPEIRAARVPKPEWLIETLRVELPDDAIVVTDACEMAYRMQTDFPAHAPRTFFYPSNYIALGWGFPASVGAAIAAPDRVVISVNGDGGFVMACQELATVARYQLHLLIVVHNDRTYGAIKNLQRSRHESRFHDTDLNNPDFLKLASAFDIPACRASDSQSFARAIRQYLDQPGPLLVEVPDQWRQLRE